MLRSLVIGLGQIGLLYDLDEKRYKPSSHTKAYLDSGKFDLVAASDPFLEREAILHQVSSGTLFYQDTKTMINNHEVDVISICTPPQSHYSLIQEIISTTNTKIIFCEKPVVNTIEEAQLLTDLVANSGRVLIPNLSRRWNKGMQIIYKMIQEKELGSLVKMNLRYTRGILNTGSHMFDLASWFAGKIQKVLVVDQVQTSSDAEGEASYSFQFQTENGINGFAEAYNDEFYYMFEIDLYFEQGKIQVSESGNKIHYYRKVNHPLFSGFSSLNLYHHEDHLLNDSTMLNAISHIGEVLQNKENPRCTLKEGLAPIFIAQALESSNKTGAWQVINYIL